MKKNSRLIALLLALFILISTAACSSGGSEETTESETASTTAPETTETDIEETTEDPYVSVVAPPETTKTPETEPPKPDDILRILMQDGEGEALISALADEEDKSLLDAREQKLLSEHAIALELSKTQNITEKIEKDVLAGDCDYDLLLLDSATGINMLCSGLLENLSEAGIEITPDSIGIHKGITESLTVGKGTYLLCGDALVSNLTSAYALRYNGAKLSSDPAEKAIAGGFTVELMLAYISELKTDAFSLGSTSFLTLFTAIGGEIFTKDEHGIPVSSLEADTGFATKYDAALSLASKDQSSSRAVFTVTKLSPLSEGEIYLPMPKASADIEYCSPIDADTISLFAAPKGVIGGKRLTDLLKALNLASYDYKDAVCGRIVGKGGTEAEQMLGIIETSMRLELGSLLGWGDLDEYIAEGMKKGTSAEALLSDRMTAMRNKAAETAAGIVADRLGIK